MRVFQKVLTTIFALCIGFCALAGCKEEPAPAPAPKPTTADFTVTVKADEDRGDSMKDIAFVMYAEATDEKVADLKTDENGKATVNLAFGAYYLQMDSETIPADYHTTYEEWDVTVEEDGANALEIALSYFVIAQPDGTAENPYPFIDAENETGVVTLTLPANATVYYNIRYDANTKIVIESDCVSVVYQNKPYPAKGQTVEFALNDFEGADEIQDGARIFYKIAVTNDTNQDLQVSARLQSESNE